MMKRVLAVLTVVFLGSLIDAAVIKCANGRCQGKCRAPIDLAIVLESSAMIRKQDWKDMKKFAKILVDAFDISESTTHVSVMSYSTQTNIATTFDKYSGKDLNAAKIKKDIDGLELLGGKQNLDIALTDVNEKIFNVEAGMRPKVPKVLAVVSTGIQNNNDHPVAPILTLSLKIQKKGVKVYAFGVGADMDVMNLIMMSSSPDNVYSLRYASSKNTLMQYVNNKCRDLSTRV